MRIDVVGKDASITGDVRAYAEFRLFAILTRYAELVRCVRVVLRRARRDRAGDQMVCSVTVTLEPSGYARSRVSKPLVYPAIDGAAERIGDLMDRRLAQRAST